jgi:hypothetical protein
MIQFLQSDQIIHTLKVFIYQLMPNTVALKEN